MIMDNLTSTSTQIEKIIECSKAPICAGLPEDISILVAKINKFVSLLKNPEIKICFFGAFKSGKSSLINSLLDAYVLPVKANRATGVVTTVRYNNLISARIVRNIKGYDSEIEIPFDERNKYILIDALGSGEYFSHKVKEVKLNMPNQLLRKNIVLVDTPGILDNDTLTELAFQACETSDLVIMVLSSDKILSDTEKKSILRIHNMLNGNIIFVVNRFDILKTKADKEEISKITTQTLSNIGNDLLGKPRIFYTISEDIPSANRKNTFSSSSVNQVQDLKEWISYIFTLPDTKRIVWNARLSVMNEYLKETRIVIDASIKRENEDIKKLEEDIKYISMQNRHSHEKNVNSIKSDMYRVAGTLGECENQCFNLWIKKLDSFISSNNDWAKNPKLSNSLKKGISKYCIQVNEKYAPIQTSLRNLGISITDFDIDPSKVPFSIIPQKNQNRNAAIGIGAALGLILFPIVGPAGVIAGGALGGSLTDEYDSSATLNLAKSKRKDLFKFLDQQNGRYIKFLESKLNEIVPQSQADSNLSMQLTAAKKRQKTYLRLKQWCDELSSTIQCSQKNICSVS